MIRNAAELLNVIRVPEDEANWVFGTITSVGQNGAVVLFEGEDPTNDPVELPFSISYTPIVGDRVLCHKVNGYWYIADAITGDIVSTIFPICTSKIEVQIGASGAPAFKNSWTNYGGSFEPAYYWMDPQGTIHLGGLVTGGTPSSTSVIFTLPLAITPAYNRIFATAANYPYFAQVRVNATGDVIAYAWNSTGTPLYLSLDGITFPSGASALAPF